MIYNIKKYFKQKEMLNDFRFSKQQSIWLIINQLRTHKIEIIEEQLINRVEDNMSFSHIKELLSEFKLDLIIGESDYDMNYIIYADYQVMDSNNTQSEINNTYTKIDNPILQLGVKIESLLPEKNKKPMSSIISLDKKDVIEDQCILLKFHIAKQIQYLDSSENIIEAPFSFNWFFQELFNYKSLWKSVLIWSLLMQLLSFALPLMTQTIIDKVIVNQAQSTLISLIIGVFLFNLFNTGLTWARQNMILFIGNKIDNTLAGKVMSKLFHLPLNYFQQRATGTIISRIHSVETIREFLAGSFITLVLDIPFVFVFLIIMFYYSPLLSAITLVFVFLMMLLSIIVAPEIRKRALEQAKISGHNQAFVTEYIGNMETVKSLQLESHLIKEYKKNFHTYLERTKHTRILAINYNTIMTFLEQTLNLSILGIGAYLSMNGQDFTIGMLIAFQMFAGRVTQPLLRISNVWQEFQQTQISMMRLKDIMDEEEEIFSLSKNNQYNGNGKIAIKNLSFTYEPHLPLLYESLNLSIAAKSLVVIKGPSGCGKSTLTKLLQGFYTNYKGSIEIDGIDIKQMGVISLRQHFGIVPQETTLFSGSILDNFKIVNPLISLEEVIKVCNAVGIHDTISKLPMAYNTHLGEKGSGLSGGQKQRIAIARALAKKPKILIFDESISNLDENSKKLVCETIKCLNGQITMVFITHIDLGDVGIYQKIEMGK